jgi:hypothetical protein
MSESERQIAVPTNAFNRSGSGADALSVVNEWRSGVFALQSS